MSKKKYKKSGKFSLDEKIQNTKFNFCKNLKWMLIAPIIICLVGLVVLCSVGFNLGIDFTGGSNMTVYTNSNERFSEYEAYDLSKDMGKIKNKINAVLSEHGLSINTIQKTTINDKNLGITDEKAVIIKYQNNNSLEIEEIEKINENIRLEILKAFGYVEESTTLGELGSNEVSALVTNGGVTTANASAELMMKSFIALLVSIVLIVIYVAFRFELTSGLAAILALFHDVLITASVVLICRIQINVAFIAALITILGYSVNNTIIIFDKMREELKTAKQSGKKFKNSEIANNSVKSMLTRTILTTLTTFISIFMITVIGVADIREFAFPIMIGIVSGFYSSVFLTPGLWAIAYKPKNKKKTGNSKPKSSKENSAETEVVYAE